MREILIMLHKEKNSNLDLNHFDVPLNVKGKLAFSKAWKAVLEKSVVPDIIITP